MKTKKITLILLLIICVSVVATTLVGCDTYLTKEDSFASMKEGIDNAVQQNEYYTKISYTLGHYVENISYSVVPDTETTDKNDLRAKMIAAKQTSYTAEEIKNYWEFGYSKSKSISDKKAVASDYLPHQFVTLNKDKTLKATDYDNYLNNTAEGVFNCLTGKTNSQLKISDMSPQVMLAPLAELTIDNLSIKDKESLVRNGVSDVMTFIVNKEGSIYHEKSITITVLYNKISSIEYSIGDAAVMIKFIYTSPKITTPNYDAFL